ncbi:MAG TPA: hypothetical protein VEL76_07610, partial [Gemmataceae bacterium]|nr:hypothetical protein [Gemmataceae bacterium]
MSNLQTQQPAPSLESLLATVEHHVRLASEFQQTALEAGILATTSPDDPRSATWLRICLEAIAGALVNVGQVEAVASTAIKGLADYQHRCMTVAAALRGLQWPPELQALAL